MLETAELVKRLPKAAGFYWGKWRIKAEGTVDEDESPGDEWEVMHVVINCIDEDDPEYLMVMVPGVAKWQALDGFVWGAKVEREAADRLEALQAEVERLQAALRLASDMAFYLDEQPPLLVLKGIVETANAALEGAAFADTSPSASVEELADLLCKVWDSSKSGPTIRGNAERAAKAVLSHLHLKAGTEKS